MWQSREVVVVSLSAAAKVRSCRRKKRSSEGRKRTIKTRREGENKQ